MKKKIQKRPDPAQQPYLGQGFWEGLPNVGIQRLCECWWWKTLARCHTSLQMGFRQVLTFRQQTLIKKGNLGCRPFAQRPSFLAERPLHPTSFAFPPSFTCSKRQCLLCLVWFIPSVMWGLVHAIILLLPSSPPPLPLSPASPLQ